MKKTLLLLTFLSSCIFAVNGIAQRQFKIIGYFPNWKNPKELVNKIPYSKVTHLNYAFQNPNENGDLVKETSDGLTELVAKAHANNVKVFVSLAGGAVAEDNAMVARYKDLCSSSKVTGFVQKIVAYADQYNLDGVDIDLEGPAIDPNTYPGFVSKLAVALHAKNKLLSAALSQGYGADENIKNDATIKVFDWVNVMAYDLTGPWDKNNPGQHSPYDWATQQVTYFKGRNGNSSDKVMFGVPFYGYGFGADALPDEWRYASILAKYPNKNAQNLDQIGSTIYYNGIPTIKKKTAYAKANAGGIMIWEISNDTLDHPYSLLNAINEVAVGVKENKLSAGSITLYPNPVSAQFSIDGLPDYKKITITVYDIMGKEVATYNQFQPYYKPEQLVAGIYFVKVLVDDVEYANLKFVAAPAH